MDQLDTQLSDVVPLRAPDVRGCTGLPRQPAALARLVARRTHGLGSSRPRSATETGGLAHLLRESQEQLAELDLLAIEFVLDGRSYVLAAAEPVYERTAKAAA